MSESITFHFEGGLAEENSMNFYEASRFQYAAARLMVKLAQFRREGSFVKNITSSSNIGILLKPHSKGSFDVNTEDPDQPKDDKKFVDLTMAELIAYVSERIIEKGDEKDLKSSLKANSDVLGKLLNDHAKLSDEQILRQVAGDSRIHDKLHPETKSTIDRRIAEVDREESLGAVRSEISKIDTAREQKLLSMSAPLMGEMATALRRSATSLEVVAGSSKNRKSVLYLNRGMAADIENDKVDKDITPILGDIIQYNKENGYGKLRLSDVPGVVAFSIPSDLKPTLQPTLLTQMKEDLVYFQSYFVRDRGNQVKRLIIVGILPVPK